MLPGKLLEKLITQLDIKQQALASPLNPALIHCDETSFPTSFYGPEISHCKETIDSFKKQYRCKIDNPMDPEWGPGWVTTPFDENTIIIIDNPGKTILSKIIAKCQISTTHNRTVVLIIGDSLADSLVRECPELSQKSRYADTFAPFLYLSPCVVPYGNI